MFLESPERYIGKTVGPYAIEGVLGRGNNSVTLLARHVRNRSQHVLRVPDMDLGSARRAYTSSSCASLVGQVARFATLKHENVVLLSEVVVDRLVDVAFVSEYVPGQSLASAMPDDRGYGGDALGLANQIIAGVAFAHAAGVVHGDIKPQNVVINTMNIARITDFGMHGMLSDAHAENVPRPSTCVGFPIGEPDFFSPEVLTDWFCDMRGDVYSLGALLHWIFAGRPLFQGHPYERIDAIMEGRYFGLIGAATAPSLGGRRRALIHLCLSRNPDLRPQTAVELDGIWRGAEPCVCR